MSDEIFIKLRSFIVEEVGVKREAIIREASIEDDLGVTGDDAFDFLIAYGKTFDVDVSKFMAADYFNGEGYEILPTIIRMFTGKEKKQNKILTVAHLEKGILAGRLDEEVIKS